MSTVSRYAFDTPTGPARAEVSPSGRKPKRVLVLGHGAGGGIDARDLQALAADLPGRGITVIRVEQPWRVAGRKVAAPPKQLDLAWLAVLDGLRAAGELRVPFVVGGRSAGARVACRTARAVGAAGALALAFPLHPPGRPERSRLAELELPTEAGLPVLVLQGTRDTFGGPADVPTVAGRLVVPIEGADHSFRVLKGGDQHGALAHLVAVTQAWLAELLPAPG